MRRVLALCFDRRVLAGLGAVAVAVWLFAAQFFLATLPVLIAGLPALDAGDGLDDAWRDGRRGTADGRRPAHRARARAGSTFQRDLNGARRARTRQRTGRTAPGVGTGTVIA